MCGGERGGSIGSKLTIRRHRCRSIIGRLIRKRKNKEKRENREKGRERKRRKATTPTHTHTQPPGEKRRRRRRGTNKKGWTPPLFLGWKVIITN